MVKRETYVLVDLTAYRNIQEYKYKQFLHEEFCTMVNLISFFTRAQPTLYRAIEGAATPKVITLTHTEERISYQIYKYYNCQNYKTYVFTTFIVRFLNGSKLNCQGYILCYQPSDPQVRLAQRRNSRSPITVVNHVLQDYEYL